MPSWKALAQNITLIHVESEHQLRRLDWIAGRRHLAGRVLQRLNPLIRRATHRPPYAWVGKPPGPASTKRKCRR